jgi:MFS family permease
VSVHLQGDLGYTPLAAGLMLMPFAIGSAVAAPVASRLVSDAGRRLTVIALAVMMSGVLLLALLAPHADPLWPVAVPALLVAGLGGGAVISPNFTLTLSDVPPRMGGAAGGALQTGQRIGSAIGAALLMTVYGLTRAASSDADALRAALLTALLVLTAAMAMSLLSLRQERHQDRATGAATTPSDA